MAINFTDELDQFNKRDSDNSGTTPTTEDLWDLIRALKGELDQIKSQVQLQSQYQAQLEAQQVVNGYTNEVYPVDTVSQEEIDKMFTYHVPNPHQITRYEILRKTARHMATIVYGVCPRSDVP